jgi:hypothetical protein
MNKQDNTNATPKNNNLMENLREIVALMRSIKSTNGITLGSKSICLFNPQSFAEVPMLEQLVSNDPNLSLYTETTPTVTDKGQLDPHIFVSIGSPATDDAIFAHYTQLTSQG